MEYQIQVAIWMQIARQIASRIIAGEWLPGGRIPSVRDLAVEWQVNPNTVARSVNFLQEAGILINQRGIGYFVAENGQQKSRDLQKRAFLEELLPAFFQMTDQLDISWAELQILYQDYKTHRKP